MSAAASSSTMAAERATAYVDRALTSPMVEYTALPRDELAWSRRHEQMPCVFRQSQYLWNAQQQRQLRWLFRSGWKDDPGHPLLTCQGMLHLCTQPGDGSISDSDSESDSDDSEAEEIGPDWGFHIAEPTEIPIHLGVALHSELKKLNRKYVLSNCAMRAIDQAAATAFLLAGPPLFQRFELELPNTSDLSFQLGAATAGSFVTARTEIYGADSYSSLIEGRRLWFMARPEHEAAFTALFADSVPAMAGWQQTQQLLAMGVHAVLQEPHDTVYVPGGWIYAVHNLSFCVWLGGGYMRPWHLAHTLRWIKLHEEQLEQQALRDVSAMLQSLDEGEWRISRSEVEGFQREWKAWQQEGEGDHEREGSAS